MNIQPSKEALNQTFESLKQDYEGCKGKQTSDLKEEQLESLSSHFKEINDNVEISGKTYKSGKKSMEYHLSERNFVLKEGEDEKIQDMFEAIKEAIDNLKE